MENVTVLPIEMLMVRPLPLWKRALDIVGAGLGIALLSPVFLLSALLIKIVSPGPVFFTQERVGQGGQVFRFLKFRTMHVNADTNGHQQHLVKLIRGADDPNSAEARPMHKLDNDTRIIPFGRFLRSSCVDELPQLFNVLLGDMSLVGPRPCIPYEAQEYKTWHRNRFDAVPGMTGLWQVSGKNELSFNQMIRLDITYARESSLALDFKIILRTFGVVVSQVRKCLAA